MIQKYVLDYDTPLDPQMQSQLERIDAELRRTFGMTSDHSNVGLLDLRTLRLAMIHPDRIQYAASIPKIGILLAWFHEHPVAVSELDPQVRHELGLMIKASDNALAAKYSRELGLKKIQSILDQYGFYRVDRGGGLWVGKHYGQGSERYGDPIADHSHAATVRQLLRFFLLLEQGRLISPPASESMRQIFLSPEIQHDSIKFVAGLGAHDDLQILRKWGSWEDWLHDAAIVRGPREHYILIGLTHHPRGDEYLAALAGDVHVLLSP